MNDLAYSGLNTQVRIYEQDLLSAETLQALIQAPSLEAGLEKLQKSPYSIDPAVVGESRDFDGFLMPRLAKAYAELEQALPDPRLFELFTSRYAYHNLKVLLKEAFTGGSFQELLLPIGNQDITALRNLVATGQSDSLPPLMVEGVQMAKEAYHQSNQVESADVMMDTYYFRHLRALEQDLDLPLVTKIVDILIDLENIATLIRAGAQNQSRGFLQAVLSNVGTVDKTFLVDSFQEKGWTSLMEHFEDKDYADQLAPILLADQVSVLQLELLKDRLIYQLLKDASFQAFGPEPVLAFLHALEMEVSNLRLILVGLDNHFAPSQMEERMRPVYGS